MSAERVSGAGPAQKPLREVVARGAVWLIAQTLFVKGVGFVTQLWITYLLAPEYFGLLSKVITVRVFLDLFGQFGLRVFLLQRRRISVWVTPVFWMSLLTGVFGFVLVLAAIPLALRFYFDWDTGPDLDLPGLLYVAAMWVPYQSLRIVPICLLRQRLRFRTVALTGAVEQVSIQLLTIAFAFAGMGAYSLVVPYPIVSVCMLVWEWCLARPVIRRTPQLRRWRYATKDTLYLFGVNSTGIAFETADYMVLSVYFANDVTGRYYYMYSLSIQVVRLFSSNLTSVLMPSLRVLKDTARQVDAMLRASEMLSFVVAPLLLAQAALSVPLSHGLLDDRYHAGAPILHWLSVAMAFRACASTAKDLIDAQKRTRTSFRMHVVEAVVFVVAVLAGAVWFGSVEAVAIAVAVFYAVTSPLRTWVSLHGSGRVAEGLWRLYARPMACAFVGYAAAWWALWRMGAESRADALWSVAAGAAVFGVVYAAVVCVVAPQVFRSIASGVRSVLPSR